MAANNNQEIYGKKKKHTGLKVLIVLLIIFLILIVLPIALAYILFYDGKTKNVWYRDDLTGEQYVETLSSNLIAKSLSDTKDTGNLNFVISNDDVDTLIHYSFESALNETVKKYVPGAYIEVDGNKYNFYVNLQTPFFPYFKTRAVLKATLNEIEAPQKGFSLTFEDAKVGKIGGLIGLIDNFITQEQVENIFSGSNISFDIDWANHQISYDISNLLDDFNITGSADNLFSGIISDIFKDKTNLLSLDFSTADFFNLSIDLSSAQIDSFVPITNFSQTLETIRSEYENATTIETEALKDRFIAVAKENNEKPAEGKSVQDCLDDNKNEANRTTYVTEVEMNNYLRGTDLIGTTYPLVAKNLKSDKNEINFVMFNDFCCDIKEDNKIDLFVNLSINGYNTQIKISGTIAKSISKNASNKLVFDLEMEDITYGDVVSLWDEETNQPKSVFNDLIQNNFSENVSINGKTISFIIDGGMYELGNAITTTDDRLNIQVFLPQFFSGSVAPTSYDFGSAALATNDRYFNTATNELFVYNGSSWGTGINVLDPLWLADSANEEIINYLVANGYITLP